MRVCSMVVLFCVGCGSQGPVVPPEPATPAAPVEAVAEPEPEPEPEPPPLTAPDGTVIADCADAPEGMSCIPGGAFTRGSNVEHTCPQGEIRRIPPDQQNYRPPSQVWVQTFFMDQTEVTYSAYQACVSDKGCPRAKPAYTDFSRSKQPMVGMNWYAAVAYCKAMGKHLPTEAEWEMAARGPDGASYPWGEEPSTCERAVIKDDRGRSCGVEKATGQADKGRTWEVALKPVGRFGLYDMIGNAEEWTADWYTKDWERCGADCAGVNPRGPCGGEEACEGMTRKVVRGGSWYWPAECATSWNRRPHYPTNKPYHHFGFRCAASLEEVKAMASAEIQPASETSTEP